MIGRGVAVAHRSGKPVAMNVSAGSRRLRAALLCGSVFAVTAIGMAGQAHAVPMVQSFETTSTVEIEFGSAALDIDSFNGIDSQTEGAGVPTNVSVTVPPALFFNTFATAQTDGNGFADLELFGRDGRSPNVMTSRVVETLEFSNPTNQAFSLGVQAFFPEIVLRSIPIEAGQSTSYEVTLAVFETGTGIGQATGVYSTGGTLVTNPATFEFIFTTSGEDIGAGALDFGFGVIDATISEMFTTPAADFTVQLTKELRYDGPGTDVGGNEGITASLIDPFDVAGSPLSLQADILSFTPLDDDDATEMSAPGAIGMLLVGLAVTARAARRRRA